MLFSSSPRTQYTSHAMMLWWRSIATHTKLLLNSAQHPRVSSSHSSDISFVSTKTCWERLIAALPFLIGTGQHYPESPTPALYGTTLTGSETQPVHTAASQLDHSTSLDSRPHHLPVPSALKRNYHKGFYPSREIIERDILSVPASGFKYFHYMLQMFISINVQCFVGGTSCSVHAANDPAFILHLANVDRIFNRWQNLGGGRETVHYGSNNTPLVLSNGLVVSQFCDNSKLPGGTSICYHDGSKTGSPDRLTISKVTMAKMLCRYQYAKFVEMDDDQTTFMKKQCVKYWPYTG